MRAAVVNLFRNPPTTRYVDTGSGSIGYQVFGDGPPNVVFSTSIDSNAEAMWDLPEAAEYFDRLSAFSRVLYYDARGSGVSDPVPNGRLFTFESFSDDTRFAMDAAGFDRATIIGDAEGGPGAMMFAATYPERVQSLVLNNTFARFLRADNYPIGIPEDAMAKLQTWMTQNWGTADYFTNTSPSLLQDPATRDRLARYQRISTSPGVTGSAIEFYSQIDVRWMLSAIQAPTLVLVRRDAVYHRADHGRYLAAEIPHAELVELPGGDTAPFFIGDTTPVLSAIEQFITGDRTHHVPDRTLATVMFTDIVDSTRLAAQLGDARWLDTLDRHNRLTRQYIQRYHGKEINTTGDGFLATFDGPTRAVTCAADLHRAMPDAGVEIRVGLHSGEIEVDSTGDIGGLAVHIASRVADSVAEPGVVVSSTVKELVTGSGIEFTPLGEFDLKGIPETWNLHRLDSLP